MDYQTEILSLLKDLPLSKRIEIIERIGKRLRRQNSVITAKEVEDFARKMGVKKNIDFYPL